MFRIDLERQLVVRVLWGLGGVALGALLPLVAVALIAVVSFMFWSWGWDSTDWALFVFALLAGAVVAAVGLRYAFARGGYLELRPDAVVLHAPAILREPLAVPLGAVEVAPVRQAPLARRQHPVLPAIPGPMLPNLLLRFGQPVHLPVRPLARLVGVAQVGRRTVRTTDVLLLGAADEAQARRALAAAGLVHEPEPRLAAP